MADSANLNKTSPGVFNQTNQSPQQTLAPAQSNPSIAATSAPPSAAPNVPVPLSQPAGAGSAGSSPGLGGGVTVPSSGLLGGGGAAVSTSGLGGGVAAPSQGLGGGVSNPVPVLGDALGLCCGSSSSSSSSSTGTSQLPVYATPGALPAIDASNVRTQAVVTDIGNGTQGLYLAAVIGPNTGWSFVSVLA